MGTKGIESLLSESQKELFAQRELFIDLHERRRTTNPIFQI